MKATQEHEALVKLLNARWEKLIPWIEEKHGSTVSYHAGVDDPDIGDRVFWLDNEKVVVATIATESFMEHYLAVIPEGERELYLYDDWAFSVASVSKTPFENTWVLEGQAWQSE